MEIQKDAYMWIVAILGFVTIALWYGNKRRGQRFVRAVHFLDLLDGGASPDEANGQVARFFSKHSTPDADGAAIEYATERANRFTEGKQLPWIHQARRKGFIIDSGDARFDMAHLSQAQPQINSDHFFSVQPALSEAYQAGLDRIKSSNGKMVPAFKAIARAAIRWTIRGAVAGFVLGFVVPRGVFGSLEIWAVPIVTAYLGALGGIITGAMYSVLRWVSSK